MEALNIKEKINIVREHIIKNNFDAIIPELILIKGKINNKGLDDQITFICSKYYEFQQQQLFGVKVDSIEREKYFKDILYLTDEAEKFINTIEVPQRVLNLNTFSNETVLNILNLFNKTSKEKNLSEEELADVLDTKVKLYDSIFKDFDNELETTFNKNLSGILFDRIISFEQIQKLDFDLIQNLRNNKSYKYSDRSLIISGITLSSINRFDSSKIHLLIDYLTDFEEGVWQKALVGIILCLIRYDNRVSLFPDLERRLEELKTIKMVQESISIIEQILRYRKFSVKDNFLRRESFFYKHISSMIGEKIILTSNELIEIKNSLIQNPTTPEEEFMSKLISHVKLEELEKLLNDNESLSIPVQDFFKLIDLTKYLELYELNPLQLNLHSEIYKNPRNWFIKFEGNEKIKNILINDFKSDEIQISDFIKCLENSKGISEIDKNAIIINIASYSDDFIKILYRISYMDNYFISKNNVPNLEIDFTTIIRELYRFQQLSVTAQLKNVFEDKISIYKKSLLDKIADKTVSDKITASLFYDQQEYCKSIEILKNIPTSEQDNEVFKLFVINYMALEQYTSALPYLINVLNFFNIAPPDQNVEAIWYARAKVLYRCLQDKINYEVYLRQETIIRASIFEKSILEDQFDTEKFEKGIILLDCYFDLSIVEWNEKGDIVESFKFLEKFFRTLYIIPPTDISILNQKIESYRDNLLALFEILIAGENLLKNIELIREPISKITLSDHNLFQQMFEEFHKLIDPKISLEIYEILASNDAIKEKCLETYLHIEPVFENVVNTRPSVEIVIVPFILPGEMKVKVLFYLEEFFKGMDKGLFKALFDSFTSVRRKLLYKQICIYFLNNIFLKKLPAFLEGGVLEKQVYNDILNAKIHKDDNSSSIDNNSKV